MISASQDRIPGDRYDAIVALYRAEASGMVRLATLLTGDQMVAEDLVHDAFIKVQPRIGDIVSPGGYLRTAVVNLCHSHARHRAVVARTPVPTPGVVVGIDLPDDLSPTWAAICGLPPRQREAIVLRFYLDLPDEDIADHLGCRSGAVRTLIYRGVATLRKELDQ